MSLSFDFERFPLGPGAKARGRAVAAKKSKKQSLI
ncbi:hypothetical protein PAMH19_5294 [Pseudomonas aeruginosa]|jgi:hypothetical protein|nr:hypothetical protein PAMH19_5294 [Pseudomonas aeruginosa]